MKDPNEHDAHAIFRPHLFLSFQLCSDPIPGKRYHVAFGSFFSRSHGVGRKRTLIGHEQHSRMIVLRRNNKPAVVGIDMFCSSAYAMPYFDWNEDDEEGEDQYWLLDPYVDRELHFAQKQKYWESKLR